jgi:serine O-acetyltransferase
MENFKDWMNKRLPRLVDELDIAIQANDDIPGEEGLDFSGRNAICEVLDDLLAVLFPGSFSKEPVSREALNFYLSDALRHISFRLLKHIREVLHYRCDKTGAGGCSCENRAEEALIRFIETLPTIRSLLIEDVDAAFEGDPAAQGRDEILFSYPCVDAIATYRIAHRLHELGVPIIPRIMTERAHSRTGIDIHPGAQIGSRFFIDHGTGVVIGETTRIGRNVKLYQGVTLGALSPFDSEGHPRRGEKRHPDIEDDVIIYANATILGGTTVIGRGAVIGGNTWIIKSVESARHVYNPATNS